MVRQEEGNVRAALQGTTATLWLFMVRSAKAFNGEGSCQSMLAHVSLFMALFKMRIIVWSMLSSAGIVCVCVCVCVCVSPVLPVLCMCVCVCVCVCVKRGGGGGRGQILLLG
jgi:hypothetical protein